ncbi:hypothetical protein CFIMG_004185RA [Ceratocystis fimbriata CBS 114723]|uniref:AA1-like domain-containing protein n=1 Tax=Ceratocystis fimbriata CBS 114723 TaxID=1035309 RepID=A0A2C5XEM9_9PEZI|nr:hypothetical protein CFIMG_004185RA [Ceratocystis fimbriata CBS 114723]
MIPAATLVLALASAAFASPLVSRENEVYKPVEITNMEMSCVKTAPTDPLFACTLTYDLNDPNAAAAKPSIKPKAACTHRWNWDGQATEKGSQNTYTSSTLECYSDGVARNVKSGLLHFSSPSDIKLTLLSSYYKDGETKSFRSLYYNSVSVRPLQSTEDTELSKTWKDAQIFENPDVSVYDPPTTN